MFKNTSRHSLSTILVTFLLSFFLSFAYFHSRSNEQRPASSASGGDSVLPAVTGSRYAIEIGDYSDALCVNGLSLRALYDDALLGLSERSFDNPTRHDDAMVRDFIAASFAYALCDILSVSSASFSVGPGRYSGIYRYYRELGYDLAGVNKFFLYDFAENPLFFTNGDSVLAYGIFIRPQTELYVRFFEVSSHISKARHQSIADSFWRDFKDFDFGEFDGALASLVKRHVGVHNIIMLDSYRLGSMYSPKLLEELIIVHELRHLVDALWHGELYEYQVPFFEQLFAGLRALIGGGADDENEGSTLSAEFIRDVDLSVFSILKNNLYAIKDKAPVGHTLPDFSRYRAIVLNNFREFARGGYGEGRVDIEPRAYDEEIRYMLSLGMSCNDVMSFFGDAMAGTVERTADREYILLPTMYNPHSQSYRHCSRVRKKDSLRATAG